MSETAASLNARFQEGLALHQQGQPAAARLIYEAVLADDPAHFGALHLLGQIHLQSGDFDQAAAFSGRAIALKPRHTGAMLSRGNALFGLRRYGEALADYDSVTASDPSVATAYNSRGNALRELGRIDEALVSYDRAVALKPGSAAFHANRADLLMQLKRYGEAVMACERALALKPDFVLLPGWRLHAKMFICDWDDVEDLTADLMARIAAGERATPALPVLALTDSPAAQFQAAAIWARKYPSDDSLGPIPARAKRDKISIGYFSPDFRAHAVATLIAGLMEAHDRTAFEIHGFAHTADSGDMRRRLARAFDTMTDVSLRSDRDVAALARERGLDIAVDLGGYTAQARPGIFALRAAPVQVNYLGYPGTMGAPFMDYIVADGTVIPAAARAHYAERVIRLPGSYQANDDKRPLPAKLFSRADLGLPAEAIVFCCFNNTFKITPVAFESWMRILNAVPESVLWLFQDNAAAVVNLRKEAAARGVAPERLIFAARVSPEDHLARHRAADLFLDTLPYNAHTTAAEALWMGVPIITCMGEAFASRVAASLLKAVGLPELITTSPAEYEALAISLAKEPARLQALKDSLEQGRDQAPLFDTVRYARNLEAAYKAMLERHAAGLAPEDMDMTVP